MKSLWLMVCWVIACSLPAQSGRYPWSLHDTYLPVELKTDWLWIIENHGSGLKVNKLPDFSLAENVLLPHRLSLPNRAWWYQSTVSLPSNTVALKVMADDGAQVWLDDKPLQTDRSGLFLLPAAAKTTSDIVLSIRVLNNALAGGLKGVQALTSDTDKQELSFSFWGDSQGGWDTFSQLVEQMIQYPDDFSLGLGDLTGEGVDRKQWLSFEQLIYPLAADRELFLVPGNHDYDGYYNELYASNYRKMMEIGPEESTYYSFYRKNTAFLVLDPNPNFPLAIDSLQYHWMLTQMESEKWKKAEWRFLVLHQFPYGQGWKGHSGDQFLQAMIDSLAEKYKIDFVLGGHNHDYERMSRQYGMQQTHFIISGGAGGGLEAPANNPEPQMDKILKVHHFCRMEAGPSRINLIVYDTSGKIIDQKKFTK